ncbi:polymer-forming cytoskeletal protein [Halolamina sp. CBA1230]|uniref:bactofilin family protein n=1 Tax=Halolamina sp. CBA1230 TaxID=1853690 RepID=UPI0009A22730|nr:polymer-forming cytoskeletal protein [Halolamina sp. CBA1230]QKY19252.1 polymer-forming cytoskeletal protein [Halolamina sp. CBA1230]
MTLQPFGRRVAAVAVVTVVLLSSLSGVAAAQSTGQFGDTIVVGEDETVDGIDGVAGTIVVRGTVTGDVAGTAGTIRITETGTVEGDLQAAGGSVIVAGTVEGDVQIGAGSFDLTDTGRIGGSLDVGAGAVTVDGAVAEDVRAAGNTVTLGPNADVGGEFRYDAETFDRSPDAAVAGGVIEDQSLRGDTGFGPLPSWIGTIYSLLTSLLLGALLLLVFPAFSESVVARVTDGPAVAGGIGLLALIAVPILLVLVAVTVVGIPFSLAGIALYLLGLWIASVYGKYAVGRWALGLAGTENRWLALLVGLLLFLLLGLVPVAGPIAEFAALLLGLGALTLGLRARYHRDQSTESTRAE